MKIGIIGALEAEVSKLKALMPAPEIKDCAGMRFFTGKLFEKDVVVVKCGIGKVNAAVCAQMLIDKFGISHIINTGVGGCLKEGISIGDIVLSTDAVEHDFTLNLPGFKKGMIPGMPASFPADEKLLDIAREAGKKLPEGVKAVEGRIATGDQFICGRLAKEEIANTYAAACCEMEGGAIAHTAFINRIPFLIIRAISDKADGSATNDYQEFESKAIENYLGLVYDIIKNV